MKRAVLIFVALFAMLPLVAAAGKGWCRSDPVVSVDGIRYSVKAAANADHAYFVYTITYKDSAEVAGKNANEEVRFVQSKEGFSVSVVAYDDADNEVESILVVNQIGG